MRLAEIARRCRQGEVLHLPAPHVLTPVVDLLVGRLAAASDGSFPEGFARWSPAEVDRAVGQWVAELDGSQAHLRAAADAAGDLDDDEQLLLLTLDKSMRLCVPGVARRNYGYQPHRDSWFDLAPDGVNLVLYLTPVGAEGNTRFYEQLFGEPVAHDPTSRVPLTMPDPASATVFACAAGDLVAFAGEQLHGGAEDDHLRLSVEFRLSRLTGYGRPEQGIVYRPVRELKRPSDPPFAHRTIA